MADEAGFRKQLSMESPSLRNSTPYGLQGNASSNDETQDAYLSDLLSYSLDRLNKVSCIPLAPRFRFCSSLLTPNPDWKKNSSLRTLSPSYYSNTLAPDELEARATRIK